MWYVYSMNLYHIPIMIYIYCHIQIGSRMHVMLNLDLTFCLSITLIIFVYTIIRVTILLCILKTDLLLVPCISVSGAMCQSRCLFHCPTWAQYTTWAQYGWRVRPNLSKPVIYVSGAHRNKTYIVSLLTTKYMFKYTGRREPLTLSRYSLWHFVRVYNSLICSNLYKLADTTFCCTGFRLQIPFVVAANQSFILALLSKYDKFVLLFICLLGFNENLQLRFSWVNVNEF